MFHDMVHLFDKQDLYDRKQKVIYDDTHVKFFDHVDKLKKFY